MAGISDSSGSLAGQSYENALQSDYEDLPGYEDQTYPYQSDVLNTY